ncbi:MAG TPA: branched-chain amino acid ABC transporter permease [Firmicutes bacterium]|uniref:branched-chain amino acid ABC transporter permease n=1 Tax=Gelria sp. Kuro-4 TaxID=2796927 RepID=UPI00198ED697|nr:branched-chain amino acid ABC transporter permease [Gelria sp. Kuro-4]BCV25843.1 branched-chain amino acid ABC transporter permease [Gelria sp. Kuro-4]HHV58371.1 branched-chain amino acid ABC transporter permease [Bacillota bacterium]
MNAYVLQVLVLAGINVILALGLNLVSGFTGQLSLGHAAFMGIGAYTAALLTKAGQPFLAALTAGGLVAALAGALIGIPTLRLRGDYLAIATLGFGEILRVVALNQKITGGPVGLRAIPGYTTLPIVLIAVALTYLSLVRILGSRLGRAFVAVREDELAADAMGIDTTQTKILAFAVGAFYAGVAGGLYAHYIRYINPSNFGFMRSIEILSMVVLGGMGSLPGAVLGAVALSTLPELLRSVSPAVAQYRQLIYGALLVVAMLWFPQGLAGGGRALPGLLKRLHLPALRRGQHDAA